MALRYPQYNSLSLPAIDKEVQKWWDDNKIFEQSLALRQSGKPFIFYEGPPSANARPGIHHAMGRTMKDLFCRYKTMKGFMVNRKGGWDTHGLPIELQVEKNLGITKEDIGHKISVDDYNKACKANVMQYKDQWDDLTRRIGYWLDLDKPYITFENEYMESLWYLLKQMYNNGYLYKGYTIQPFSPAAGTGLSSAELNYPGTYQNVKDTTIVAQFKMKDKEDTYFLAWTTTPWTLPSNTALAVGPEIEYVMVETFNPYTAIPVKLILAKALLSKYFKQESQDLPMSYELGQKELPYRIISSFQGHELIGMRYEQLMPYQQPESGDAFRVIGGDFVTTEDGTGIVHIAPSFGSDDLRVAKLNGIGALTLVDKQGKFIDSVTDFAGRYVKDYKNQTDYVPVDIDIAIKLKKENRAFKVEKYEHSYPHCWRTDKPIIYYPLDSWFIAVTKIKDQLVEANKEINWKPEATGTGRFGNWLENGVDWNLSRSRFWGTPLPIWRTDDGSEELCIGSIAELESEIQKANKQLNINQSLPKDLHRPYIDEVVLVSPNGIVMKRELDLIDVWFDSGAMPFAQWHYPFENQDIFEKSFPADYIAEGVDQTRGWFYTLHTIAGLMNADKADPKQRIAFKNVIANGLVQDKTGAKMSKSKGNAIDPFETINQYGADAARWYMISNSQPWENLKFDMEGLAEKSRSFFGTLFNTYSFFALYANVDEFTSQYPQVPLSKRPEIDRWILSRLHSLIRSTEAYYDDYEPTWAARGLEEFMDELSNWYVRLCRKRFWNSIRLDEKSEDAKDKLAAYQTLHTCIDVLVRMMSPIAPFFAEYLYKSYTLDSSLKESVHLCDFPQFSEQYIDGDLEERMSLAQKICSLVLALRKKEKIKVRQPLRKILIPISDIKVQAQIKAVENLIMSEVNVKEINYITDTSMVVSKSIKPDFKALGKKVGPLMKEVQAALSSYTNADIAALEANGQCQLNLNGESIILTLEDVQILTTDIPGWLVNSENGITVALDISIDEELYDEGIAREFINRIQRLRKESDFDVTDKIKIFVEAESIFDRALRKHAPYICAETLTENFDFVKNDQKLDQILDINEVNLKISISKIS